MNILKAFIWKEWREQRLTILAAVTLMLIGRGVLAYAQVSMPYEYFKENVADTAYALANIYFPLALALVFGVTPLANEFAAGSLNFMMSRAVSMRRFVWTKFSLNLVLLHLMIVIMHAMFPGLNGKLTPTSLIIGPRDAFPEITLAILLIYLGAFLTSILIEDGLGAFIVAPLLTAGVSYIALITVGYAAPFILSAMLGWSAEVISSHDTTIICIGILLLSSVLMLSTCLLLIKPVFERRS
ncbi:MAG: hypothetical protein PHT33_02480 [bacterium]|nr:hypothetical protein [bacterium]